jgi:hypothetical protein
VCCRGGFFASRLGGRRPPFGSLGWRRESRWVDMGLWRVVAFAFEAEFLRKLGRLVVGEKRDVYAVISAGDGCCGSIWWAVRNLG